MRKQKLLLLFISLILMLTSISQAQDFDMIISIDWSPDGEQIVIVYADGLLEVIMASDQTTVFSLYIPAGAGYSTKWSPDGMHIFTGDRGGAVIDVASQSIIAQTGGHLISGVAWYPDGSLLAHTTRTGISSSIDISSVLIRDTETYELVAELQTPSMYNWIRDTAWSPSGQQLAALDERGMVTIWEMDEDGDFALAQHIQSGCFLSQELSWNSSGDLIALSGICETDITIINLQDNSIYRELIVPDSQGWIYPYDDYGNELELLVSYTYGIDWHPTDNQLAIILSKGLWLWDFDTGDSQRIAANPSSAIRIRQLTWHPKGTELVYATTGFGERAIEILPMSAYLE